MQQLAETPRLDPAEAIGPQRHPRQQQQDDARNPNVARKSLGDHPDGKREGKAHRRVRPIHTKSLPRSAVIHLPPIGTTR